MKKVAKISKDYLAWIAELKKRYKATQIKAAVAVNSAMLEFYWHLGRDICARYTESKLGNEFYQQLSADLKNDMPEASGLPAQNLKYCGYFYRVTGQSKCNGGAPKSRRKEVASQNWQEAVISST